MLAPALPGGDVGVQVFAAIFAICHIAENSRFYLARIVRFGILLRSLSDGALWMFFLEIDEVLKLGGQNAVLGHTL